MTKAVLFDLDGTLVQSNLFSFPAYRRARAEFGLADVPDQILKQEIGGTMEENWRNVMPERSFEAFCQYCNRVLSLIWEEYLDNVRPYDGMRQALAKLREKGYLTVLCSNGSPEYCTRVLQKAGLLDQFDQLAERQPGADKVQLVQSVLQKLAPVNAVMVGDRRHDAQAARGNHIPFIGCRYGLFPEEIDAQQPEFVLDSAINLVEAVEKLL